MIVNNLIGYYEGKDDSKVPDGYLTTPSKNVLFRKGVAFTRGGFKNDGTAPTGDFPINGEFVWKDSLGGEKPLRSSTDGKLGVKYGGKWHNIFDSLTINANQVRFATWIDSNPAIIKKRLFAVDGTDKMYEWSGAIAKVQSVAGNTVTIQGIVAANQLGFDIAGVGNPKNLSIYKLNANGEVIAKNSYVYTDTLVVANTITMTTPILNSPQVGDLIIQDVKVYSNILTGIKKDEIYTYKNSVIVSSLESVRCYCSDWAAYPLNYTIPPSPVSTSARFFDLVGNFTAMISKFNANSQSSVLWVSDADGWAKIKFLEEAIAGAIWTDVQRLFQSDRTGALPFCVSNHHQDLIYISQDNTLQRVETVDVTGQDRFTLLSFDIEALLNRVSKKNARIYYRKDFIFMVFPESSTTIMLDTVTFKFQTPQILPVSLLSVIGGVECGHSSSQNETFTLFTGRKDLTANIVAYFAFPYNQGANSGGRANTHNEFLMKESTKFGMQFKMTEGTNYNFKQLFNYQGSLRIDSVNVKGTDLKAFLKKNLNSLGSNAIGTSSLGIQDTATNSTDNGLAKYYWYIANSAYKWFEHKIEFEVTGEDVEFWFLGSELNDTPAGADIPANLYYKR